MKEKTLLLLSILLSFISTLEITPNLKETSYFFKDGLYRLKLGVDGGSPPYTFNFLSIPESWIALDDFLFVPHEQVAMVKKHVIRVEVSDSMGQTISFSTIALTTGEMVKVEEEHYPVDHTFSSDALSVQGNEPALKSSTKNSLLRRQVLETELNQKIDDTLLGLPTLNEFESILSTFNNSYILETITSIRKVNANCISKVAYLQEMLGRIYSTIESKKMELGKVEVFNDEVSLQIEKIEAEVA